MFKKIISKISSNLRIYGYEVAHKGFSYLIKARLKKFQFSRTMYLIFKSDIITTSDGIKMRIDKHDTVISDYLSENKVWDDYQTTIIKNILKQGDIAIDIGAHIGYYTLLFAKLVGPSGKVYSFEPEIHNFKLLKQNIEANKFDNIHVYKKAVASKKSYRTLYIHRTNTGDNRLFYSPGFSKKVSVETVSLDHFLGSKLKAVNFMKVDIQGFEFRALQGMKDLITKNPSLNMVVEYCPKGISQSGSKPHEFIRLVRSMKFFIYLIHEGIEKLEYATDEKLLTLETDPEFTINLLCLRKRSVPFRS